MGMPSNIEESQVGVVSVGEYPKIREGDQSSGRGALMEVQVGEALRRTVSPTHWRTH